MGEGIGEVQNNGEGSGLASTNVERWVDTICGEVGCGLRCVSAYECVQLANTGPSFCGGRRHSGLPVDDGADPSEEGLALPLELAGESMAG